jgi:hypothetical protein
MTWLRAWLCVLVLTCSSLRAQETTIPLDMRDALAKNAECLKPITVSWSRHFTSLRAPEETLATLELDVPPLQFFAKTSSCLVWQDNRIYSAWETPLVTNGSVVLQKLEASFDGKILYRGYRYTVDPHLFKQFMSRQIETEPQSSPFHSEYLKVAGFRIPQKLAEWEAASTESEVLYLLGRQGKLKSVENVTMDSQKLMRVELIAENSVKRSADEVDLEKLKKESESWIDSPERKRRLLARVENQRRLPGVRRFVYYLDPSHHFAVRRWEQWYDPDTLLLRCDCSGFERCPDRELWLPRTCKIDHYEFDTAPGKFFTAPIVSELYEVSSFKWQDAANEQFVLNYTMPGTRVRDWTLPEAKLSHDGYVYYTVPARREDLDRVIEDATKRAVDPQWAPRRGRAGLFAVNVFVLLLMFVTYLSWRRWRSKKG